MKTELDVVLPKIEGAVKLRVNENRLANARMLPIVDGLSSIFAFIKKCDSANMPDGFKASDSRKVWQGIIVVEEEIEFSFDASNNDQPTGSYEKRHSHYITDQREIAQCTNPKARRAMAEVLIVIDVVLDCKSAKNQNTLLPSCHADIISVLGVCKRALQMIIGEGTDINDTGRQTPDFSGTLGVVVPRSSDEFRIIVEPSSAEAHSRFPDAPDTDNPEELK